MQGFQMMLKAMGVDPEKIMADVNKTISEAVEVVNTNFAAVISRMEGIEKRLGKIEDHLAGRPDEEFTPDSHLEAIGIQSSGVKETKKEKAARELAEAEKATQEQAEQAAKQQPGYVPPEGKDI